MRRNLFVIIILVVVVCFCYYRYKSSLQQDKTRTYQGINLYQHNDPTNIVNVKPQTAKDKETPVIWKLQAAKNQKKRFVIAFDYYEQQSGALRNLIALVAWANTINGAVVEPCVNESFFSMEECIKPPLNKNSLYFRDYFDIDNWNQNVLSHKLGQPLVPWEQFISNKPNKVILVYIWNRVNLDELVFVDKEIEPRCYNKRPVPKADFHKSSLDKLNITIVREVCFILDIYKQSDLHWFNSHILGNVTDPDVAIFFTHWAGIFKGRTYLNDPSLNHNSDAETERMMKLSPRVIKDSKRYQEMFLGDHYVAIALRIVKLVTFAKHRATIEQFLNEKCPHQVSSALEKTSGKRMLALDLGRFGDGEVYKDMSEDSVNKLVPKLVRAVYGDKWNWTEWENSFIQATGGITDGGYIASLQKTLVMNAPCIVMAGKLSLFQRTMLHEYNTHVKKSCVQDICKEL